MIAIRTPYNPNDMEILRSLSLCAAGKDMPFLLIGGHAVNVYGLSRQTGDVDLVVKLASRERWLELFAKLGYEKGQHDDRFARFMPASLTEWSIDLRLVDDQGCHDIVVSANTFTIMGKDALRIGSSSGNVVVDSPSDHDGLVDSAVSGNLESDAEAP